MIFFALMLIMPLVFLLSAMIVDAYNESAFDQTLFSRFAWPFGVVIFFPDYLSTLPRILEYYFQGMNSALFLTLIAQVLWMGSAFAILLILFAALLELPLRWYAGNTHLQLSPVLQACRPLIIVSALALLARWLPEFFAWKNLMGAG
jgi:hypothetical protein